MSKILLTALRSSVRSEFLKSRLCSFQSRTLCISSHNSAKSEETINSPSQKKSKEPIKVTLVQQNQIISVTSLDEAQKLARRRDLRLIKVQEFDSKSQRPIYRLASASELLTDDENFDDSKFKKTSTSAHVKKSEKSLTIGCRIADNDLASRLKNITKWLTKGNEVKVLIQCVNDDGNNAEKILQKIETAIREPEVIGKITQKRSKENFIKFNIVPVPITQKMPNDQPA